jgi:two-component system, cell cycle response regulator
MSQSAPTPHSLAEENRKLRAQLDELLAQARRNEQIMQRHQTVDLQLIGAGSFRELIEGIIDNLRVSSGLDVVTLSLIDSTYDIRRILVDLDINPNEFPQLLFMQDETEFGDLCTRAQKPLLGVYSEQLHGILFPEPMAVPASVAVVPLVRKRQLIGSLNLGSADASRFQPQMATDFIEHLSSILAICIENVINQERLKRIGLTDPLTGVHNRRYVERRLQEEIGRTRRQGYSLSCLFIDIDHFKSINDQVGHQSGDVVLREVASRIKAELRLSDALGRFGGEEFVVLLIDAELGDAANVAERIRAGIADQPVVLQSGVALDVTVSIGVATLVNADRNAPVEVEAQQFVAKADRALYQAKETGRNKVVTLD